MNTHPRPRLRPLLAGLTALVCLLAVSACGNSDDDPTDYVRDRYDRSATHDEPDGGAAFTSREPTSSVVRDLRRNTGYLDHRRARNVDYLQYPEHIVAVRSHGARGSMIYVDDYRDGYRRYAAVVPAFVAFGWSSSPPGSGGFSGGGRGSGK